MPLPELHAHLFEGVFASAPGLGQSNVQHPASEVGRHPTERTLCVCVCVLQGWGEELGVLGGLFG